ncbi:MAG: ferrous iron transport protein A [Clostridiales bacterium]|nr:ferrous iron transport protein A [Clostridiales bacterium]
MTPLSKATVGDTNMIRKITGDDEVRSHLAELGVVVGVPVTVVSRLGRNLLLTVNENRVALDEEMAAHIQV